MKRKARRDLRGFLALLPAFLIAGVVGGLFLLNLGGGGRVGASTTVTAGPLPSTADKARVPAPADQPGSGKGAQSRNLRILSWNLRDCAATDGATGERLAFHEPIAGVLAGLEPDLAAFEEIQQDDEKGGDIALLQVALAKAGWAMPYQTSIETGGQDDIALFSRFPILASESVLEPVSSDPWPRPGLHAVLSVGAQALKDDKDDARTEKLDIFVFHLKAMSDRDSEASRKAQAKALADLVRKGTAQGSLSRFIVIAGDLNTTNPGDRGSATSTLGFLELKDDTDASNDFLDVIEGLNPQVPTFVDKRYSSVLDHLILSPGAAALFKPGSARVFRDFTTAGSVPISDHRPVLLDLSLGMGK